MSRNWQNGSTPQWRRVRKAVLERDGYICRLQLPGCQHTATEAHHVHGRSVTGDDPQHIVAACKHCNLKIGDPTRSPPGKPMGRRSRWSA